MTLFKSNKISNKILFINNQEKYSKYGATIANSAYADDITD